jgi:hypothetical protein
MCFSLAWNRTKPNNLMQKQIDVPYLSVVAASRNDDHGGDPLIRTQIFLNCLAWQAARYELKIEIILVDWNPVPDRQGLGEVLALPTGTQEWCKFRVVTVPASIHAHLKYGDRLPLFQMIAKNVGIRRAFGEFVLATNIDIILSNDLFRFIANRQLHPRRTYRVDRVDIGAGLAVSSPLDQVLEHARTSVIRHNKRLGPARLVKALYAADGKNTEESQSFHEVADAEGFEVVREGEWMQLQLRRDVPLSCLHTNACGDFTLLSKAGWQQIGGYPEFETYSMNIDSIGLAAAHYGGFSETTLSQPCVCYHIEHAAGSGWTPEGETKLYQRLRSAGIVSPEWPVLMPLVERMRQEFRAISFNGPAWGLADCELEEICISAGLSTQESGTLWDSGSKQPLVSLPATAIQQPVRLDRYGLGALKPGFDYDKLSLAYERDGRAELLQIYVPSSNGEYSEDTSRKLSGLLRGRQIISLSLSEYQWQKPLRMDPAAFAEKIIIHSILLIETIGRRILADFDGRDSWRLTLSGLRCYPERPGVSLASPPPDTANGQASSVLSDASSRFMDKVIRQFERRLLRASRPCRRPEPLVLSPLGADPQIYLPPLKSKPSFPIAAVIDLEFVA